MQTDKEEQTQQTPEANINESILENLEKMNKNLEEIKSQKETIKQNEAHAIDTQSMLENWDEEDLYKQRLEMLEIMGKADRSGKINLMNFDHDALAAYMWVKKFGLSAEEVAREFDNIKGKVIKLGSVGESFIKDQEAKQKFKR